MSKRFSLLIVCGLVLLSILSACGTNGSVGNGSPSVNTAPMSITPVLQGTQPPQAHEVAPGKCSQVPSPSVVTNAVPGAQTIYVGSASSLYAISASNGAIQWCRQATISGSFPCPVRCPPPPFVIVGRPAVANGVVYVCLSGFGGYTYALRASDGATLWRVKTGCAVVDMPFGDYAEPLLYNNVVYSGTYALRPMDGAVYWHTSLGVAFQRLVNGVVYASSEDMVYALDARNGSLLWQYEIPDRAPFSGRLVVDNNRVYAGTLDSVNENDGALYALDAGTGTLLWRFTQGAYYDIHTLRGLVFVIARDRAIYALDGANGAIRWTFKLASYIYASSVDGQNTLYVSGDGVYALQANTGREVWHKSFNAGQSDDFTPVTAANGVIYVGETDGSGNSVIYALNASTGAEYWHTGQMRQVTPLTI